MRPATAVLTLFAVLFAGCAAGSEVGIIERSTVSTGPQQTVDVTQHTNVHTRTLDAPKDRTYRTAMEVMESLSIPLHTSRPSEGIATFLLQANRLRIAGRSASDYVDCGSGPAGPRANSYRVALTATVYVEAIDDATTRFHTVVSATARDPGTSSAELACSSTGRLERMIGEKMVGYLAR